MIHPPSRKKHTQRLYGGGGYKCERSEVYVSSLRTYTPSPSLPPEASITLFLIWMSCDVFWAQFAIFQNNTVFLFFFSLIFLTKYISTGAYCCSLRLVLSLTPAFLWSSLQPSTLLTLVITRHHTQANQTLTYSLRFHTTIRSYNIAVLYSGNKRKSTN